MTPTQLAYLKARETSCNPDSNAISALTIAVMPALGTGCHNRRHIYRIVRNHFLPSSKKVTDISLRTGFCDNAKLARYKELVREYMRSVKESLSANETEKVA